MKRTALHESLARPALSGCETKYSLPSTFSFGDIAYRCCYVNHSYADTQLRKLCRHRKANATRASRVNVCDCVLFPFPNDSCQSYMN